MTKYIKSLIISAIFGIFITITNVNAASTFLIDFGGATYKTTTSGWNTVVNPSVMSSAQTLKDSSNLTTSATVRITNAFGGENMEGTTASTVYPASASRDSFWLGSAGGVTDDSAQVVVAGLTKTSTYNFTFYASRLISDTANRTGQYKIGNTTVELNATNNVNNTVSINDVIPSATGSVTININRKTNAWYGYLGVLKIVEVSTNSTSTATSTPSNISPTANAGTDKSITQPVSTTTLTGSGTDSDGTISSYLWSYISGPTTPTIVSSSSSTTNITGLTATGTYTFRLTVTDNSNATGTDDVNVIVNSATSTATTTVNNPPVVNAGSNQNVTMPISYITLSGTATDDGTITSYSWSETSSNYSTIVSPNSATTLVKDLAVGTYNFKFTATDNKGLSSSGTVTVVVAPHQLSSCSNKTIVILGSSTSAGYGLTPISDSYANRFTSYVSSINNTNSVINLAVGGYTTYQLMPTGSYTSGRPSPDTNANITKALSYNPQAILINLPSNDVANGYSVSEQQANFNTIVSAATAKGIPVYITTTQPRNMDDVSIANQITMRDWILSTYGNNSIDFWTTFANANGTINSLYDQGDGIHLNNVAHKKLFTRVANSPLLNVACSYVATSTPTNIAPTANAGTDKSITQPVSTTTLTGSGTDSDGTISSYLWSYISGPTTPTIVSSSSSTTNITGLTATGTYTFRLTVTDNSNATGTDDVLVNVINNDIVNATSTNSTSTATTTNSKISKFNVSAASATVPGWTNIAGDPSTGIRSAVDAATGFGFKSLSSSNWGSYGGANAFDGAGATADDGGGFAFPAGVVANYWYNYDNVFSVGVYQTQLYNLDPTKTYTITILGSRGSVNGASAPRVADYNLRGNTVIAKQVLDVWLNTSKTVTFSNVQPSASGTIDIAINKKADNTGGSFGYLNGITVTQNN